MNIPEARFAATEGSFASRRMIQDLLTALNSPSSTIPAVAHFGISGETRRLMLIPKSGRRARDKNGRESSSSEDSQNWTLGFLTKMTKQSQFDELNPQKGGKLLYV